MTNEYFNILLIAMTVIAAIVFITLYFVEAGYGMLFDKKWGKPIPNKIAWICMEAPVFLVMLLLWSQSGRQFETAPLLFFLFFELHYLQRAFIFPLLIKGKSKMPAGIMTMGIVFNLLNGYIQGMWIFYLSPESRYSIDWLCTPQFIIGTILFFTGMYINWRSDYIVRHLRKPGDTNHYLPKGGLCQLFRRVGRVVWFCNSDLECQRCFVRLVDIRKPRTSCQYHLAQIQNHVRKGSRKQKTDHSIYILIIQ